MPDPFDEDPLDLTEIYERLEPAYLGTSIPTLTSGTSRVFDLELALGILGCGVIQVLNHKYVGGPNPIFISKESHEGLGFHLGLKGKR